MNNQDINDIIVSEKHVVLRKICFLLALLVAVGAFTFGVTRIGHREEGSYALTAAEDPELPLYRIGVHAEFVFQGSSSQIKLAIAEADKAYTEALKRAWKLLDPRQEYVDCVNLATLNARPNQDVRVSPELFAVLTDAWDKTREQRGYSLFAGPLYAEWEDILILSEPEDFDPLRNEEEARRLEQLREQTGDLSRLRLTVTDRENCVLRLEVPEEYLRFLESMEREPLILDLNLLREAYLLELTAAEMREQGLRDGFLRTDSGLILCLEGQRAGEYCLYGRRDGWPLLAATAPIRPGSAYCQFTAFPLKEGEGLFYAIEEQGKIHLRNPYLPADGRDRELLLSSCVICPDGALAEACYENLCLRTSETAEELASMARSGGQIAWILLDRPEELWLNPAAAECFSVREDFTAETAGA